MKKQWLYHLEHDPEVFVGENAILSALQDGWVDTPAKLIILESEKEVAPIKRSPGRPKKVTNG